jgi:transcriptional regulator with GAF, ATPase, and Fis domain
LAAAPSDKLFRFVQETCAALPARVVVVLETKELSAEPDIWRLLEAGASDIVPWSADAPRHIAARLARWAETEALVQSPQVQGTLVGQSPAWLRFLRTAVEIARYDQGTVLLMGESGTGKERVAHAIHQLDAERSEGDLVVVDCTTIVPELSGSEFFGHERGAFTGATAPREGAFALANGGTLFLDEVGELPLPMQAQLLRVIQEKTYKRVGSNLWHQTDFRLICATNRDLKIEVTEGRFRHDLYHRIASHVIALPPLRQRPDDILPLAQHFVRELCPEARAPTFDPLVRQYLLTRAYPGNVRELRQTVCRLVSRHAGAALITAGDIPHDERDLGAVAPHVWPDESFLQSVHDALNRGIGLKEISRAAEDAAVRIAASRENGNLQRAARMLGVTDRALQLRRAHWRGHSTAEH